MLAINVNGKDFEETLGIPDEVRGSVYSQVVSLILLDVMTGPAISYLAKSFEDTNVLIYALMIYSTVGGALSGFADKMSERFDSMEETLTKGGIDTSFVSDEQIKIIADLYRSGELQKMHDEQETSGVKNFEEEKK